MRGYLIIVMVGVVILGACERNGTTLDPELDAEPPPTVHAPTISVPNLVVSDPVLSPLASAGLPSQSVAYVSVPPHGLTDFASVRISNFHRRGTPASLPISNGGFDPVAIEASAGDVIRLELSRSDGQKHIAQAIVPASTAPTIVRVVPEAGSAEIAADVRPEVVLSEPVKAAALNESDVRLLKGGTIPVAGTVEANPAQPWRIVFTPASPLEPGLYELVLTRLEDLEGKVTSQSGLLTFMIGALSPEGGTTHPLAFVSTHEGTDHIYVLAGDGSAPRRLTAGVSPRWSPDGTKLVFSRNPYGFSPELWVANVDGSSETEVGLGIYPDWSPDGKKILFVRPTTQNELAPRAGKLMIMNADGTGITSLSPPTNSDDCSVGPIYWPRWSPDGQRIAFGTTSGPGEGDVCIMNADGTGVRGLVPGGEKGMVLGAPVWSPDGSRIAVDALLLTGPEAAADIVGVAILSYPVDSSERRSVISSSPVWYEMGAARLEDWSPDGKELTVSRLVARNPGTHLGMRRETYALDLATGSFQDLAELPSNIWNVAYSPVR